MVSLTINATLWMTGYVPITVKLLSRNPSMEVFTSTVIGQLISWASLFCDLGFRVYLWLILPLHIGESNEIISHKTVFIIILIHFTGTISGLVFSKFIYTGITIIVGKALVVPFEIFTSHQG